MASIEYRPRLPANDPPCTGRTTTIQTIVAGEFVYGFRFIFDFYEQCEDRSIKNIKNC